MHNSFAIRQNIRNSLIPAIASVFILQACAPAGFRPVSEQKKDTTGSFDGRWVAVAGSTASTQQVGNWRMICTNQQDKRYGPITVSNGEVSATLGTNSGKGFIDATGVFRVEVPTDATARETGTSDGSIGNGAITVILNGSLADQAGFLTFGIAEFANAGCATSVTYNKV